MQPETQDRTENYFLLMDPSWDPEPDVEVPPIDAIIGLWPLHDDGTIGRFRANPDYVPHDENSATDPLDAVLRLAMSGQADAEQLQLMLRDSLFEIGMNGDGRPLIARSPDDVPCVVVVTSASHRARVDPPAWRRADLEDLVQLLADGVDVLINPRGPASTRLTGGFIRETVMMSDDDVAAAWMRFRTDDRIAVVPWEVGGDR
jgi:hypothetical protein